MTNSPLLRCDLLVKKSPVHGYGVFANQDIQVKDVIEECHTLYVNKDEKAFSNYIFITEKGNAFPLGYGVIYNHSDHPNAECLLDVERSITTFRATKFIKAGEEIFIFYGKNWFSSRNLKHKELSRRFKLRRLLSSMPMLLRATAVALALFGLILSMRHITELFAIFKK